MADTEFEMRVDNGWVILPASLKSPANVPRFHLEFPYNLAKDAGANILVRTEFQEGYEVSTRNLLEKVLRPGDLFVDVGAHWGFFTLQATTHPAGNIRAIAIEPDPRNAFILHHNIVANGLTEAAHLVCAACGAGFDIAPLVASVTSSSMMNSIRAVGLKPPFVPGLSTWVPIISLDTALACFPWEASRRVILKVDTEGFETHVIAGARALLDSRRVALIIWELGRAFFDGTERSAMIEMVDQLSQRGFRHFRPSEPHVDGAFVPFNSETYTGNVFSFGAGLDP